MGQLLSIGAISNAIAERPQTVIYPISLAMLMTSMYYSSPLLAVFGGMLLLTTILHYGSKST